MSESLNIFIIGAENSGKSTLFNMFVHKISKLIQEVPTDHVEIAKTHLQLCSKTINIKVWDTPGSKNLIKYTYAYISRADGIIIMYSITSMKTFRKAKTIYKEVRKILGSDIPIMFIGNKSDLEDRREVSVLDAASFCAEAQSLTFVETSTLSLANVEEAFKALVTKITKRTICESSTDVDNQVSHVVKSHSRHLSFIT